MSMIRLSNRCGVFLPESQIESIECVHLTDPDGSPREAFDIGVIGRPVRRFMSEPTRDTLVAAPGGLSVLVPVGGGAGVTEWLRHPVIAWRVTTGVTTGTTWSTEPVCDPDPLQSRQEREQAVLIDSHRRQARRWLDDYWMCDLAEVFSRALGVGTRLDVAGDPWAPDAQIVTCTPPSEPEL